MRILILVLAVGGALLPQATASAAPDTCWNLPAGARTASTLPNRAAVDCDSRHTAQLLGRVRGERLTPAGAFRSCHSRAVRFVNQGSAASSALPRTAQLSVYVTDNRRRALCVGFNTSPRGAVVGRVGSVRDTGLTPRVCLNTKTWQQQACSLGTSVAMTNVAWMSTSPGQRYPGNKRAMRLAAQQCLAVATPAGLIPEAWFVPGVPAWNAGNRYALCQLVPNATDSGWQPLP